MGVLGCWRRARAPTWRLGTHTLRGSIPGADEGREEPRPGGGGAGSKPFTALWGDQSREGKGEEKERLSFKNHLTHSKKFICSLKLFLFLAHSKTLTAQGESGCLESISRLDENSVVLEQ